MEITLSRPWVQVFKFLMVFSVFLDFAACLDSFAGARNDRKLRRVVEILDQLRQVVVHWNRLSIILLLKSLESITLVKWYG